jgi:hypothetical protein
MALFDSDGTTPAQATGTTVKLREAALGTDVTDPGVSGFSAGIVWFTNASVNNDYIYVNASADPVTAKIYVFGEASGSVEMAEAITLTNGAGNGPAWVRSTATNWNRLRAVLLTEVAAGVNVTIAGVAASTDVALYPTLSSLRTYYGTNTAIAFTALNPNLGMTPANLDWSEFGGASVLGVTALYSANLQACIDAWNNGSKYVTAARTSFVGRSYDFSFVAQNAHAYTITIASPTIGTQVIKYLSDGSATTAEIAAGFLASFQAHAGGALNESVEVSNPTSTTLRVTSLSPKMPVPVPNDANIVVTATAGVTPAGAGTAPYQGGPWYLSGGDNGTVTAAGYLKAIDLLQSIFVNTIVMDAGQLSVIEYLGAHCKAMLGSMERDAKVGLTGTGTATLPTFTELKAAAISLNNKDVQLFGQSVDVNNTAAVRTTFMPWMQGCIAAGMQAGGPVGTPLTNKQVRASSVSQDSSWNPTDDGEQALDAGVCFMERQPDRSIKITRSVTTYLAEANLAYIEASVNDTINYSVYNLRQDLKTMVGRKGTLRTVSAIKSRARKSLDKRVEEEALNGYSLGTITLSNDVCRVPVDMEVPVPVNFILPQVYVHSTTIEV